MEVRAAKVTGKLILNLFKEIDERSRKTWRT